MKKIYLLLAFCGLLSSNTTLPIWGQSAKESKNPGLFGIDVTIDKDSVKEMITHLFKEIDNFFNKENIEKFSEVGNLIADKISPIMHHFLKISTALSLTGLGSIVTFYGIHTTIKTWIKERHEQNPNIQAKYKDQRIYYSCLSGAAAALTGICLYILQQHKASTRSIPALIQTEIAPSLV